MKKYLGQLISIEFDDLKEIFSGFLIDYSEEWILLRKNPVDFVLDGYILLKHKKVKTIHRDEDHELDLDFQYASISAGFSYIVCTQKL